MFYALGFFIKILFEIYYASLKAFYQQQLQKNPNIWGTSHQRMLLIATYYVTEM